MPPGVGTTARSVSVRLAADVSQYVTAVGRNAVKATKDLNAEIAQLGKDHKEKFNQVALAAGGIGTALLGVAAVAVKSAMTFDKEMSAVGAVSEASGKQLDMLRTAALAAGKATVFSATQAAQAEEELAKAGMSTNDILRGGLIGAMGLASAGGIGLAEAATTTATALNIFGLSGDKAGHAADLLAAAANKSATDVHELSYALSQGGLVAKQANLSLDDTVGVLAAFASQGLRGSDAGTSLKTMFLQLEGPSKIAAGAMKEYGLNVYDAQGKMMAVTAIAQQLQDKFGGLSEAERNAAFAQIFGNDAVRAANVLYTQGAKGIQGWIDKVNDQGAAADSAAKRMDNLAGDVENLKGTLETLFITSGEGASGGLRSLTQGANRILQSFMALPGPVQTTGVAIAGVTGGALLLGAGMLKARQKIQEMQTTLTEMGPIGAKTSTVLGKVTGVVGKLTLAIAALQVASAAMGSDVTPKVSATEAALSKFAGTGTKTGEALSHLSYDLGTLGSGGFAKFGNGVAGAIEGLTGLGSVMNESLYHAKERISAIDTALADLQAGGHAEEARAAFDKLADAAKKQGISLDDLKKGLPEYTSLLEGATTSEQAVVVATQNQKRATDLLTGSLKEAIDAAGGFDSAWKQLHGTLQGVDEAMLSANQAVEEVTATLKKNHGAWKGNSDAALENRIALGKAAEEAAKAAQAKFDETGSVDAANKVYKGYIDSLKEAITKLHLGKTATAALLAVLNQMAAMPPIKPRVEVEGLPAAWSGVQQIATTLRGLDGKTFKTYYNVYSQEYLSQRRDERSGSTTSAPGWHPPMAAPKTHRTLPNIRGGYYEHAESGLLRDAQVYAAVGTGARYAFAEPGTGGEAFVPKHGDVGRSRDIAGYVVNHWLGGSVNWGGNGGGGGDTHRHLHVHPAKQNLGPSDLRQWQSALDAYDRAGRRR